jgi:hypothetical protein
VTVEDQAPSIPPEPTAATASAPSAVETTPETKGRLLLGLFWVWAGLLVVVTIAQLFDLRAVLDVLDVKRWFAR